MNWKDFFYYSEHEKKGILLLLILIVVVFGIGLLWKRTADPPEQIRESDSLKLAFEEYQKSLIADEEDERNRNYERNRKRYSEKYKRDYYLPNQNHSTYPYNNKIPPAYVKQEKLLPGQTIAINEADTNDWKKVPGVGSGFAKRIIKYKELLGGFVSEEQLMEVYGFTPEMYAQIRPFVRMDAHFSKMQVNQLSLDRLAKHPYLNYRQAKVIVDLRQRRGKINSMKTLQMLDEFSEEDIRRLNPYLSFE
ncbi:MAG: helix-hairpin-helix domain-containing protein [Dysgonamonadaceae bacterium]